MGKLNQPSNQIKLTNVSIVRFKKGKKRYELACYKNKVLEYRSGIEKDLDSVLQIAQIFTNVSKGLVAPKEDLSKSFPKLTNEQIILEILQKGELQVGEKERSAKLEQLHNEVVSIVAGKCVDPKTKRVYTGSMIEKALNELRENPKYQAAELGAGAGASSSNSSNNNINGSGDGNGNENGNGNGSGVNIPTWHGVHPSKPAKALALEAIKALIYHQPIPIARARMKLRILIPSPAHKKLKPSVLENIEQVVEEEFQTEGWECVGFVEPGKYKILSELVSGETKGRGKVEVVDMADVKEGDETG